MRAGSAIRRSDRSIVHADRRQRGGECAAAGRRAPEERFEQTPVRLERAHHEPDPAGPVGRRRCSAADRVRRIRVRDVPRHSLDNGPPPGHHGAARPRGGRPAPGVRRHGGELVTPGRRRSILDHPGLRGVTGLCGVKAWWCVSDPCKVLVFSGVQFTSLRQLGPAQPVAIEATRERKRSRRSSSRQTG